MLKMAEKYPKVRFEHCGGLWTEQAPEERRQLFRLHRRGAVPRRHRRRATPPRPASSASSPPSRSRRCCATSTPSRSARSSANPKVTTQVIFTGDWSMPVKEAEATNSLVDQGVDVITCHVDGPKIVIENAARRGAMICGYHVNQARARAQGLSHRRRVELGGALSDASSTMIADGRDDPELLPRRPEGRDSSRSRPMARRCRRRRASRPTTSRPSSMAGGLRDLQGPAQGQQGQDRDRRRRRPRTDRSRAREDELSGRGRDRSDFVTAEAGAPAPADSKSGLAPAFSLARWAGAAEYVVIPLLALLGRAHRVRPLRRAVRQEPARPLLLHVPGRVRHLVLVAEHADAARRR